MDENEIEAQRSPARPTLSKGTPTHLPHKKTDTPPSSTTPQKPSKRHAADDSPADTKPLNPITNLPHTRPRQYRQTALLPTISKKAKLTGNNAPQRKDSESSASPDTPTLIKQYSKSQAIVSTTLQTNESADNKKQLTLKSAFAREQHIKSKEQQSPQPAGASPSIFSTLSSSSASPSATTCSSTELATSASPPHLDKDVIKWLEAKLERHKEYISSATQRLERARAELVDRMAKYETEEQEAESQAEHDLLDRKALEDEVETLKQLLETMETQMNERESEIKMQKSYLDELSENVHVLEREVYEVLLKVELEEERLLIDKEEEIEILRGKIEESFDELTKAQEDLEAIERRIEPGVVEELRMLLKKKDQHIQRLESQIELEEDSDFVASLNLTVQEELAALKAEYSLTSGSELDKEVAKCQAKLQAKFDRDFTRLKEKHTVMLEQTEIKIKSSEKRLESLNSSIQEAIESTLRSEQDRVETEKLLEQEIRKAEELEQQIRDLQQRVAVA